MIYCAFCIDKGLKVIDTYFCRECAMSFCDSCVKIHDNSTILFKATKIPEVVMEEK